MYSPNLPQIRDAPLARGARGRDRRAVVVDNDANVATIGEATYGAAAARQHVLLVTLGTGIGGGMLLARPHVPRRAQLRRRDRSFHRRSERTDVRVRRAWSLGGDRVGDARSGRMARELVRQRGGAAIVAAAGGDARVGHGVACRRSRGATATTTRNACWSQYAENVALGLAGLANILDPECIVIAGGLVELGPLLFGPLRDAFGRHVEGVEYRPVDRDRARASWGSGPARSAPRCSPESS